jgi:RNA polymerase sigma factor (sigma-70 family)
LTTELSVPVLVARAADGDEQAWGALVDRYAPLVWSICRRYGLSRADADDVAQGVWLRLLESLPALRTPEALPGWLATTTRRDCLRVAQALQGRAVRERSMGVEAPDDRPGVEADVEQDLLRAERRDALRAAYAALGERCRRLLGLLLLDPPPPYAQISAELDIPIGSIGPTRARCIEALRRYPSIAALMAAGSSRASREGGARA